MTRRAAGLEPDAWRRRRHGNNERNFILCIWSAQDAMLPLYRGGESQRCTAYVVGSVGSISMAAVKRRIERVERLLPGRGRGLGRVHPPDRVILGIAGASGCCWISAQLSEVVAPEGPDTSLLDRAIYYLLKYIGGSELRK